MADVGEGAALTIGQWPLVPAPADVQQQEESDGGMEQASATAEEPKNKTNAVTRPRTRFMTLSV